MSDTTTLTPPVPVATPEQQAIWETVERAPEDTQPPEAKEVVPSEAPDDTTPDDTAEPDDTGAATGEVPAPLPEKWDEREEVKTRLKDSHVKGWREGYSKADIAAQARINAITERGQVFDGLQDLIKSVEKVAEDGGLLVDDDRARRGLADLLNRSELLAKAIQISEGRLRSEGQEGTLNAFMGLAASTLPKDHQPTMSTYVTDLLQDIKVGLVEPKDFWPSLFKRRDEFVAQAAFDKGRQAGITAERKANGKATGAEARTGLKTHEAPGGSGGGGLTPEAYKAKLARGEQPTSEEIDAMTRRFVT